MLAVGSVGHVHRPWFDEVRPQLRNVNMPLLAAVVPGRRTLPELLGVGLVDRETSMESQLQALIDLPPDEIRRDLNNVWRGRQLPPELSSVLADEHGGNRRLADAFWQYWTVAIEPHWSQARAVLDADVAFRTGRMIRTGMGGMLAGLHPEISVERDVLSIDKPNHSGTSDVHEEGLLLVPSVFVWPNLIVSDAEDGERIIVYAARGVGNLRSSPDNDSDEALGALLGRTRAAIVSRLALPFSTSELACALGQTPPAISQHLAVLRRSGMVTSWRAGRSVLYQRTAVATSLLSAAQGRAEENQRPA
jgi:DNA-binding transcriptional ArsR family regulator